MPPVRVVFWVAAEEEQAVGSIPDFETVFLLLVEETMSSLKIY